MCLELRRVLCSRAMLLLLVFLLVVNMGLFSYAQARDEYGFSDYTSGSYTLFYGEVDAEDYLTAYTDLLFQYQNAALEDVEEELSALSGLYDQFGTVLTLWQSVEDEAWDGEDLAAYRELYERFLARYPDMESRLEDDTDGFRQQVYVESVAAGRLLAQVTYLQEYDSYLESIRASADQMLLFSIFNTGFTERSIQKTAQDFASLDGVTLSLGNTLPVQAVLNYRYADFFLLALLLFAVLQLLQERSGQFWPVAHAAKGGRARLAVQRCGVQAICAVVFVVLLYGSTLLEAMLIYRADWSVFGIAAQSVEALKQFPVCCTVLGLFARLFLFRVLSAFVIALVLWLLLSAFPQGKGMYVAVAAVLAVEYSLYAFLPDNSAWNLLKYGNLFCLVFSSDTYCTYFNLNFFEQAVGLRAFGTGLCAVLGLVSLAGCVLVQCKKRPYSGRKRAGKLEEALRKCSNAVCAQLGSLGFALYQSLILRHGWLVLLCFFLYSMQAQYSVLLPSTELNGYYAQLEGPVGTETYAALAELQADNTARIAQAEQLQAQWEAGELTFQEYFSGMAQYGGAYATADVLADVEARLDELAAYDGGETLWVIDSTAFDEIYGEETTSLRTAQSMVLLLAMCLLLAGTLATERQARMLPMVRATARGRGRFLATQYAVAAIELFLLCGIQTGFELQALRQAGLGYLSAPVQSISWLSSFPIPCSVRGFLALYYGYRLVMCLCLGCLLLWLSALFAGVRTAEACAVFAMLVPSALALYFDFSILRAVSAALPLIGLGWLWDSGGQIAGAAMAGAVLLLAATAATVWTFQRRRRSWS